MTPAQITAALSLSLAWRRRLAEQEGPGWYHSMVQVSPDNPGPWLLPDPGPKAHLRAGIVMWAPASPLAWLDATGLEWEIARGPDGLRTTIYIPPTGAPDDGGDIVRGSDPIDAALKFMLEHPCPSS